MTLLDRVKNLCRNKGISQGKMEKEIGISNGASSKWKTSSPSLEILEKLSNYFEVSVDYLMTGKEPVVDYLYSEDNADFLIEIQKRSTNPNFVDVLKKYLDLKDSDKKSVDDMIDYLDAKNKKEAD